MARDTLVRTYDPKKVIITLGTIIISGYAEGTFVQIAGSGDNFEKVKGADGGVDRVNKNTDDYTVTITLKQTSITNDALSALLASDKKLNTGTVPLSIVDLSGTSLFFATQAWIAKEPDDEYGDSLANNEWKIDTGVAEKFTGGNT